MVVLVVALVLAVILAGLVVVYVAYPHRGADVPAVPWLGEAMRKGAARAPILENTEPASDDDSDREPDDVPHRLV